MKIDIYISSKQPTYTLVVPTGTDLSALQGQAGDAIANMTSLTPRAMNVTLEDHYRGDLLAHLQNQIADVGAGLVKTEVSFREVTGD